MPTFSSRQVLASKFPKRVSLSQALIAASSPSPELSPSATRHERRLPRSSRSRRAKTKASAEPDLVVGADTNPRTTHEVEVVVITEVEVGTTKVVVVATIAKVDTSAEEADTSKVAAMGVITQRQVVVVVVDTIIKVAVVATTNRLLPVVATADTVPRHQLMVATLVAEQGTRLLEVTNRTTVHQVQVQVPTEVAAAAAVVEDTVRGPEGTGTDTDTSNASRHREGTSRGSDS